MYLELFILSWVFSLFFRLVFLLIENWRDVKDFFIDKICTGFSLYERHDCPFSCRDCLRERLAEYERNSLAIKDLFMAMYKITLAHDRLRKRVKSGDNAAASEKAAPEIQIK
ncbi:MAG: hypothetical protein LBJ24_00815 [Treponema sp.]|nr:hypothetical protein [Treponema sp.]